jgi:aromatic-L-amino-acid decarboxylase
MEVTINSEEETLDPLDWNELRLLGHKMVDDMIDYLATVRERPPYNPISDDIKKVLDEPLPIESKSAESVYEEFLQNILPYPMGNIHPRFWGWVIGTGTPLGMFAEMLSAAMNSSVGGGDHVANYIEMRVIEWCKQALNYHPEASGLLVSGCSMANIISLAVARNDKSGFNVREEGVISTSNQMTIYGSTEMHFSLQRAVEILGLGNRFLRRIPVDNNYKINIQNLEEAIKFDINAGMKPICVIANVGTVNTGAIDPINDLARIAHKYNLWLHVDGAFGALVSLSPDLRYLLQGMEYADSLAIDLHKWLHLPYEVGCVLIRNERLHRDTFATQADYIDYEEKKKEKNEPINYRDYGLELSRSFRALKVWMSIKTYGTEKLGRLIYQNCCQARYLTELIENSDKLEILAPVELNIVCFRFIKPNLSETQLDEINKKIRIHLRESGIAVLSSAILKGKYALRCSITNHRTKNNDLDLLASEVVRLGITLSSNYTRA